MEKAFPLLNMLLDAEEGRREQGAIGSSSGSRRGKLPPPSEPAGRVLAPGVDVAP